MHCFIDIKVMELKGINPEISTDLRQEMIQKGIDPSKLTGGQSYGFGYLEELSNVVTKCLEKAGYEHVANAHRKTGEGFINSKNNVYSINGSEECVGSVVLGAVSAIEELIGMLKAEVYVKDENLTDQIRDAFKSYSQNFVEICK